MIYLGFYLQSPSNPETPEGIQRVWKMDEWDIGSVVQVTWDSFKM